MNTDINLCEILKGHEGETFYSPAFGEVKLFEIKEFLGKCFIVLGCGQFLDSSGCLARYEGECMLFPSEDQRDWNKWLKSKKVPKTWNDLIEAKKVQYAEVCTYFDPEYEEDQSETVHDIPIEKSALALLKIYQLIEVGYGGNITTEEWESSDIIYTISCDSDRTLEITGGEYRNQIAFHTEEQAKEFLSYPENIQLLKDFYMI